MLANVKRRLAPRKKPTQARAQATVEAILTAAAEVFAREEGASTSTNTIAARAGVSVGTLYQYFPDRDALLAALIQRHNAEGLARFEELLEEVGRGPLEEAVHALVSLVFALHLSPLHRVLTRASEELGRVEGQREQDARVIAKLETFLTAQSAELRVRDPSLAAFTLGHLAESLAHAFVLERPDVPVDRAIAEVSDLVLAYLRGARR